jgi:hypothetical protein
MSIKHIENLITLHHKVELTWNKNTLFHNGVITNTEIIELLAYLESDECDLTDVTIEREGANLVSSTNINEKIAVTIVLNRNLGIFYGRNLNDLLTSANNKYCSEQPKLCYLAEENWKSWEGKEQKQSIYAYIGLIEFVSLLKKDISDHNENTVVHFLGANEKVSFPLIYSADKVESHQADILNSLAVINTLMNGENYRADKATQLKAIIIDITKNFNISDRFDFLLGNIEKISSRFAHNHELFISGFSFDDKKELLKAENRKYTSELNNTINSIHARIVSIPIGTIGASILLKSEPVVAQGLESIVLASSVFIIIIIAFSLFSQYLLLNKVRNEYKGKWGRMKTEIPKLENELRSEYKNLENHFFLNRALIISFSMALLWFSYFPISTYLDFDLEKIIYHIMNSS